MGIGDELKNLAELHRQGALNDAEFEAAKKQVLDGTALSEQSATPSVSSPVAVPQEPAARSIKTNGLAIASFALGLLGMGVGHVVAIFLGYRAKRQIDTSNGTQGGRGLAIAGIVLGWIGLLAVVIARVARAFLLALEHRRLPRAAALRAPRREGGHAMPTSLRT